MRRRIAVLLVCIVSVASAAQTGVMQLRVRDSHSHFPLHAVIQGTGVISFSVSTDDNGYGRVALPPGEYQLQISASGYAPLSTHYPVELGKTTMAGAFLDPLSLPHEESSEVLDSLIRPGYTLLHEYVVDAETGRPLIGVKVTFIHASVEATTDSKGHYYLLVPTPAPNHGCGIGSDTLVYKKPGYKTLVMKNLPISAQEMGGTGIELQAGVGKIVVDATHKLCKGSDS